MKFLLLIMALMVSLTPAARALAQEAVVRLGSDTPRATLLLRTTTDIAVFAPAVTAFLATRPDLAVLYEQWGSNDLYELSARECREGRAQADVVISSGVHQMIRLVNDRCAQRWQSPITATLPPARRWRDEIWGISSEPAVMVYNRALVPPAEVPQTRFDLLDLLRREGSPYAGRVATYDIERSGLGFLFAFMDSQEASTFGALMEAFARTNAVATCCSAEIIGGVLRGDYLIAYNVLGSYAQAQAARNPTLGIIAPRDYTLVLSRAAMIARDTQLSDAGALVDFLLSTAGQIAMAALHLATNAQDEDPLHRDGIARPIMLAPTLLVAMDSAHVAQFTARWRAVFARQER